MNLHDYQVLFYAVVTILEVYRFFNDRHQNKRLAELIDRLDKSDSTYQLDK